MSDGNAQVDSAPIVPAIAPRMHLVVHQGGNAGVRIPCRRVVTLLGSRTGCKAKLNHENVAPVHLAIINDCNQLRAVDLVTPRGTLLNGLKMEIETLSDGDMLSIGPWELRVEIREARRPESTGDAHLDLEPTPNVIALEHIASHRILQPHREACVIGRNKGCDIHLSDKRASRSHALLFTYFGHPAIVDLLSKHRTLVNDQPIAFAVLKNEDVITVGESEFRVRLVGSSVGSNTGSDPPIFKLPQVEDELDDHIDIGEVDSAQNWRIADKLRKATGQQ